MSREDGTIGVGRIVGIVILVVLVSTALGWFFQGNDFFMYKFFAPRNEAVRREVYENTKSYKQGSVQRLNTLCTQVASADDGHKGMINDVIAHEFVEWDMKDVPDYLRPCLAKARAK